MLETLNNKENYYGYIGSITDTPNEINFRKKKYIIIQSLWTKPILQGSGTPYANGERMKSILYIAALSLAYAHRSDYEVHMHTDSKGMELLKDFGYDVLENSLDDIPDTVPTELFAAGKFYAMEAEGMMGKVHIDYDVFLKKPTVLEKFYTNKRIDAVCQQVEDYEGICFFDSKINAMKELGYPKDTVPEWRGSVNTGVIGFNNPMLAMRYMNNYKEALKMYTKEMFDKYKKNHLKDCLQFDFILEQVNMSRMSMYYNLYTLVPTKNPTPVADEIGYQHLQGTSKWSPNTQHKIKKLLLQMNPRLYKEVNRVVFSLL